MNLRSSIFFALSLNTACAATQQATTTAPSGNRNASEVRAADISRETDGRWRTRQAMIRAQYHEAFDQSSVVVVDLMEGYVTPDFWRVHFRFTPPVTAEDPALNVECLLNGFGMPSCAVVMPPRYQRFELWVEHEGPERFRFSGHLRVRRANQPPVEYQGTTSYDEADGVTDLTPVQP